MAAMNLILRDEFQHPALRGFFAFDLPIKQPQHTGSAEAIRRPSS
jgi:hypothetical protein